MNNHAVHISFRIAVSQGNASRYKVGCSVLKTIDNSTDVVPTSFYHHRFLESTEKYYFTCDG